MCASVCGMHMWMQCLQRPEEGVRLLDLELREDSSCQTQMLRPSSSPVSLFCLAPHTLLSLITTHFPPGELLRVSSYPGPTASASPIPADFPTLVSCLTMDTKPLGPSAPSPTSKSVCPEDAAASESQKPDLMP